MNESKKRKGRKPVVIDESVFNEEYDKYITRKITKQEMAEHLHIARPTLDKILREKGLFV